MKKVIRYASAIAICLIVAATAIIPAFATTYRRGIVYYKWWRFGGDTSYSDVKQGYISETGVLRAGTATHVGYAGNKHGIVEASGKFTVYQTIPESIQVPTTPIRVDYKLMKSNSGKWSPVTFADGKTVRNVTSTYKIQRYKGSSDYTTANYETMYNIAQGDYKIDVTTTYVAPVFQSYVKFEFEADITQKI